MAAVERAEHGAQLAARGGDPRDDDLGGEAQRALDAGVAAAEHPRAHLARGAGAPAVVRQRVEQRRLGRLEAVDQVAGRAPPAPGSARAGPRARPAAGAPGAATSAGSSRPNAAPDGAAQTGHVARAEPQHRADQPAQLLAARGRAEHVQPVLDLDVLDLAQVAVDVLDERAEVVGTLAHAEVGLQVRALDRVPDARRQPGQLGRVEDLQARVLVEQRLELGQLVVGLGAHHRRDEVVDDHRVRAALGLHALARVVDHERVDERHVAERRVGRARRPTARASCPAATRACRACPGGRSRPRPRPRRRSGSRRGSGGSAAAAGRGRSRPDRRRSRAAAGWPRARCRAPGRPRRSRRRRRTGRRAAGPSAPRWPRAARRAASRTSRR